MTANRLIDYSLQFYFLLRHPCVFESIINDNPCATTPFNNSRDILNLSRAPSSKITLCWAELLWIGRVQKQPADLYELLLSSLLRGFAAFSTRPEGVRVFLVRLDVPTTPLWVPLSLIVCDWNVRRTLFLAKYWLASPQSESAQTSADTPTNFLAPMQNYSIKSYSVHTPSRPRRSVSFLWTSLNHTLPRSLSPWGVCIRKWSVKWVWWNQTPY